MSGISFYSQNRKQMHHMFGLVFLNIKLSVGYVNGLNYLQKLWSRVKVRNLHSLTKCFVSVYLKCSCILVL